MDPVAGLVFHLLENEIDTNVVPIVFSLTPYMRVPYISEASRPVPTYIFYFAPDQPKEHSGT
jgi:hypothetical protein